MLKSNSKIILAIETSCDETAIAVLKCSGGLRQPGFEILANEVSSQIKIHRPFGGVVPNLAKREHIKNLPILYSKIFENSKSKNQKSKKFKNLKFKIKNCDLIAVTVGPGLEPALWAGITFAEDLAKKLKKTLPAGRQALIGVNHMEGHLYGFLLSQKAIISNFKFQISKQKQRKKNLKLRTYNLQTIFPAIGLVVSGGHTILLKMTSLTKWEKLGETVDDAVGEAFDKVARILDLPYPGGPEIERLALSLPKGEKPSIKFPRPLLNPKNIKDKYNFSFSGLKTSVLYYLRDNPKTSKADIAASFQQAAIDVLTKKAIRAAEEFSAQSIILCGGVACNKTLRETLAAESEKRELQFISPEIKFNTDNAAMIGVAAYIHSLTKKKNLKIEADSNLNL